MKKILLIVFSFLGLFSPALVRSQSFTVAADTVWATVGNGTTVVNDTITNTTGSTINLTWSVIASDFPADWLTSTAFGICDANLCRGNTDDTLWNGTSGNQFSCAYSTTTHAFDLSLYLTGASTGTHYVTVNIVHGVGDSKTETFVINRPASAGVSNVNNADNNVLLYPNPARDELNVVYNSSADVKTIAVYNIIGKIMMVYKVAGDGANLNLENIPSGIYFVRLANSHGDVVVTRKFTKQ